MLMLLAIIEMFRSYIQRILLWLSASSRPRYRCKLAQPADRHNHRHSPQKPEWLKTEIIRLKALMPPKQEQWFEAWDGLLMGYELKC